MINYDAFNSMYSISILMISYIFKPSNYAISFLFQLELFDYFLIIQNHRLIKFEELNILTFISHFNKQITQLHKHLYIGS